MQEQIKLIEEFQDFSPHSRVDLLLVLAGKKPATDIGRNLEVRSPFFPLLGNELFETYISFFDQFGLPYYQETSGSGFLDVLVARDENTLNRFRRALRDEDWYDFGLCVGYPISAVEAYFEDDAQKLPDSEKIAVLDRKYWPYAGFQLSKRGWETELEVVKLWHDTVQRLSPKIHDAALQFAEVCYGLDVERAQSEA